MNKISKLNFKGQQVHVGIAFHKKSKRIRILTDSFAHKIFTQPPALENPRFFVSTTR